MPNQPGNSTPFLLFSAPDGVTFTSNRIFRVNEMAMWFKTKSPADLKTLHRRRQATEKWYATVSHLDTATLPKPLKPLQQPLEEALRKIGELLEQCSRLEEEPLNDKTAQKYAENLAGILAHQNTVERIAGMIREHQQRHSD